VKTVTPGKGKLQTKGRGSVLKKVRTKKSKKVAEKKFSERGLDSNMSKPGVYRNLLPREGGELKGGKETGGLGKAPEQSFKIRGGGGKNAEKV